MKGSKRIAMDRKVSTHTRREIIINQRQKAHYPRGVDLNCWYWDIDHEIDSLYCF